MSYKRSSQPPARPPPPKGGLSLGGMSFKKLEQEEEEDEEDLTISDKYTSLLHTRNASAPPSLSVAGKNGASTKADPLSSEARDTDKGTPQKRDAKGAKSKLEMLSELKGKIQEKIHKTIEDISGDSSASVSPDREHPISGSFHEGLVGLDADDVITKASATRVRASSPPAPNRSLSASNFVIPETDDTKPLPEAAALEKRSSSQPVQLSSLAGEEDEEEEENIMVFEEHFKEEPFEDFAGGLLTSTVVRQRSKLKKKSPPKTTATVSMSGLMKPPDSKGGECGSEGKGLDLKLLGSDGDSVGVGGSKTKNGSLMRLVSHDGQTISWSKLLAFVACVFAYLILPMPSFLSGLIAGVVLSSLAWVAYNFLMQPPHEKEPPKLTPIEDLPPMEVPEMKEPTSQDDGNYKGWMNEISIYNPDDYHINHTYSIYVTLEGTKLRLQRPKVPVQRRATHDEVLSTANFIHQRHFELKGSSVFLQPPGLVKKRVWSKKYPICIALAETGTKSNPQSSESSVDSGESVKIKSENSGVKNDMGFEIVSEEKCESSVLYLFARTCREKEEWFRRFHAACQGKPLGNTVLEMRRAIERQRQKHRRGNSDGSTRQRHNSTDSQSSVTSETSEKPEVVETEVSDPILDFTRYMGHLMPAGAFTRLLSPSKGDKDSVSSRLPFTGSIICDSQLYWLNALIGRSFYDFLRDKWWSEKVKDKLQRKLSKIHVPYFIEELQVTAIDMGKEMPVVRRAANPYLDERGFWVELDISYGGGFQMTIETKMNLMKLKTANPKPDAPKMAGASERSPVTDPDEEDSAESSTDEEEEAVASPEEKESGGKKLMKYLNKLTASKYFQQATEYKYIKRAMENVSNTPLQLQVSVKNLVGKLAINVPHPPSDRLWYGFRGAPRLWLVAKPQVGERKVTMTHVTEWIERKLESEFQRVFVMPNMDDLVIPILRPAPGAGDEAEDENLPEEAPEMTTPS